jgi:hypothetical protein
MGIFGQDSGGYRLGPLPEALFSSAAMFTTEAEHSRDHAVIDSRWIVDRTA